MFQVGQEVVYPVHGAGVIKGIEQREILGELRDYYVLHITTGDLRVLIPVEGVENAGLRQICDPETLKKAEDILQGEPGSWVENWNKRYRVNMEKLKTGDILEIALVVRTLFLREQAKGLSAGEKKMLDNAFKILLSEMVMCTHTTLEESEARMKELLRK